MKRLVASLAGLVAVACSFPAMSATPVPPAMQVQPVDAAGLEKCVAANPCNDAGFASVSTANLTRPANTTTYTANTGLANATSGATYLTFSTICRANGKVVLIPHVHVVDYANQTTKLSGVLYLFNAPPASPINDNATFSITSADMAVKVATIPFTVSQVTNQAAGASGSAEANVVGTTYEVGCGASTTSLYAMVQVTNAYVPVSAEQYTFTLKAIGAN